MPRLVLENIVKRYGRVEAVPNVNLVIDDGEFVVLVGPSGCGKSTVLRMIAGLETPTSGRILLDGVDISGKPAKDRNIAMVFQDYALYPHMSVRRNMSFSLSLRSMPKAEIEKAVLETATILGIETLLDRLPGELSGGQRQRVALGRAMVREPELFLFDEPLSNLDAALRGGMRVELSRMHRRLGATSIYVTHDQVEAMTMGTKIVVMKDGRVLQIGKPIDVYNRPANHFVASFIGHPKMNFIETRVEATAHGLVADCRTFRLKIPQTMVEVAQSFAGRDVLLGIRPADVSVQDSATVADNVIEGIVDLAEPLGSETHVYCRAGPVEFLVAEARQLNLAAGRVVHIHFDLSKAHLFDRSNDGQRISRLT